MAKFCVNCGKELNENADVCLGCGKTIVKDNTVVNKVVTENENDFTKGTKAWLIICIVAQSIVFLINIIGLAAIGELRGLYIPYIIFQIIGLTSYILLLAKKLKIAYFLIIGTTICIFILNIMMKETNTSYAFAGLLNPIITFAAIKNRWHILK